MVLAGDLTFRCGDNSFDVIVGGFVFLPRGIEHGYRFRSEREVHLLVITSPADVASRNSVMPEPTDVQSLRVTPAQLAP